MTPATSLKNCKIRIFGPQILQNELLADYVAKETGYGCASCKETDLNHVITSHRNSAALILWDCLGKGISTLWSELGIGLGETQFPGYVALFNVSHHIDIQIEKEILKHGIRGIFLQDCPRPMFIKGIQFILAGELWFSRKAMTQVLLEQSGSGKDANGVTTPLTPREKEIFFCVASGASNDEISCDLNISLHTVKSHVYKIYKKINVPNRLQAALWTAKNL